MPTVTDNVLPVTPRTLTINGGSGRDLVILDVSPTAIVGSGTGGVIITDQTANATVRLQSVEYVQFGNRTLFVQAADDANVARLYAAAFNRAPDVDGLRFWQDIYDKNVHFSAKADAVAGLATTIPNGAFTSIAQSFVTSAEFQSRYGALDNAAFVGQLYTNVLGRTADATGLHYWENVLATGGANARAAVLVSFAESTENAAKVDYVTHPDTGWLFAV